MENYSKQQNQSINLYKSLEKLPNLATLISNLEELESKMTIIKQESMVLIEENSQLKLELINVKQQLVDTLLKLEGDGNKTIQ